MMSKSTRQGLLLARDSLYAAVTGIIHLPAAVLLLLIRIYQRTLSPALPVFFGSACGCRFSPTCSHYAADAIRIHGAVVGVILTVIRLVKCTPFHPGGVDLVPPRPGAPRCVRVDSSLPRSSLTPFQS